MITRREKLLMFLVMFYCLALALVISQGCAFNAGDGTQSFNWAGSQNTVDDSSTMEDATATDGGLLDGGQVDADPTSPPEADSQNSE
jgi:hypothetical protein